jgi:phage tail sheath protein FI
MVTAYKTPGVYIEEIPKFPPSIAPVETAIPAFIGYTQKADDVTPGDLHLKPTRISSMLEYERYFGVPQPEVSIKIALTVNTEGGVIKEQKATATLAESSRSKHIMYYALQMFFANGGGPCYIVSVNPYKPNLGDALVEGELAAGLTAIGKEDEPTLIVFPEAQSLTINDFQTLHDAALAQCENLKDRFVIMDVHGGAISLSDPGSNLLTAVGNFRSSGIGINNLKYGAAYAPNVETVLDIAFDENATEVTATKDGTAQLPVKLDTFKTGQANENNQGYEIAKAAIRDMPCKLPPAAAMAGIYAAVDNTRGVWKAPANVSVNAVIAPTIQFTNVEQDQLNVDPTAGKSVNAVRPFIGKGTLVWGARTLAGNDNEWRYINVRRLFIFVEESVKKATSQFVFEANDANTWVKVQGMIENFLTTLWRQGALQGVKPEHAFYVAVGLGKTMTALDILEGRMIVEIGLAAVRPAEFIILRFSHKMAES